MSLAKYRQKRNFTITPEPSGAVTRAGEHLRFVIQKHAARRLHYDLRLELDGTLKSWAVPKGPSLDPANKRLAVHVEDHPLAYGSFEGIIPEKQYGAGEVIVWDHGWWTPVGDAMAGYRKGHLKFELEGEKLHGRWALVRMHGRRTDDDADNWLLIKEEDDFALPGEGEKAVDEQPQSVISGRTLADVKKGEAAPKSAPAHAPAATAKPKAAPKARTAKVTASVSAGPEVPQGATKARLPDRLAPQLATLTEKAPTAGEWAYEVKFDGYRLLARLSAGKATLYTRNGHDWTASFPGIVAALEQLPAQTAWLDGEACVMDAKGLSSFGALQRVLAGESKQEPVYMLFDLPYLDGHSLADLPLLARKDTLKQLLATQPDSVLRYSDHLVGAGSLAQTQACQIGLEGLIGKRLDSRYGGGRTRDWLKLKCRQRQEFVIGGYTPPSGSRSGFGSLLLGVYEGSGKARKLRYAGRVGTGFDEDLLADMLARMKQLARDSSPFVEVPRDQRVRGTEWVKPELVAEITFAEWTEDGRVRQGVFEGLREDKPAREIGMETAQAPKAKAEQPARRAPPKSGAKPASPSAKAGGKIVISHPERVVYPDAGITKQEVADYYASMAEWLLPHIAGRPLSLVRCPGGAEKSCFFQKHADELEIPGVDTVLIQDSHGRMPYIVANDATALQGLAQMNTLELHAWNAQADDVERPDMFVIDFDPDEGLAWHFVADAARAARALFDNVGLESFLKTTGGKGLHVVVPIVPERGWDEVKDFTRAVADRLVEAFPERFTATVSKARRKGKIFIDYLRNGRGATAIVPYSPRARAGGTVAMPIPWEALDGEVRGNSYAIRNALKTLAQREDPWAGYFSVRQKLTARMQKAVGI